MSKKIEHVCKNCVLYNPKESVCAVTIMHKGEELELTTKPNDECHWEKAGLLDRIKQIRVWKEGGEDKIEYPTDDPNLPL